jgi:hypothetical protein
MKATGTKGYKIFGPDFTCRGFQYVVGKTYETELDPVVCSRGFHFCRRAIDCFNYYPFDTANKVAEIIALGAIAEEGNKCATDKIKIVREIPWAELLDLVNTGKGNAGHSNSGHRNSGHRNSGDCNSGDRNSGHYNSGDSNSGDSNSGHRNSGDFNSGHSNSGHANSGNWNQGDFSTGDFNAASHQAGCFCTEEGTIRIFDRESGMTFDEWRGSEAYSILSRIPFEPAAWIWAGDMADDEKAAHPEHKATDGYLRINSTDRAFLIWWDGLDPEEKAIIRGIPNFDPEKFRLITGIEAWQGGSGMRKAKTVEERRAGDDV